MSESLQLGIPLAVVGGFLEAYTFVCRGGVFANCQTGNMVLFALNAASGNFRKALLLIAPVIAFMIGVLLTEKVKSIFSSYPKLHWRQITILFEIVCLVTAALIPSGKLDVIVTTLIAFVCAIQVESFRKLRGSPYATTMCTGNLRSATDSLFLFLQEKDHQAGMRSSRYFLIVLFFMLGAVAGAALTNWLSEKAVLICCVLLLAVFLLMFIRTDGTQGREGQA